MKYAVFDNGIAVDVFKVDPYTIFAPSYANRFVEVPDEVDVHWRQVDEGFEPPPPPNPVPAEVTMRQARLALLGAGKLALVAPAIAALPEPQRSAAQIEWEYSATVERNRPFVLTLGAALGLSAAQLDQLFIVAATL
ncbi:MAG: hypothetical protein EOO22_13575 [Comamonadaceae bacterium]|nr:MAG: hypothetical protein EOO22_13575 [Comamonadaceae bacterium]